MTKDEALRMVIEVLEAAEIQSEYDGLSNLIFKAIQACKEALAETQEATEQAPCEKLPSREWVGLSDAEVQEVFNLGHNLSFKEFARAIEAKLRIKNGY